MLNIDLVTVTDFEQNCRILWSDRQSGAVVVDPGGDVKLVKEALAQRKLQCEAIWLTHSHLDHCGGVAKLKEITGAPLFAHKDEAQMRLAVAEYGALFGLPPGALENCPEPDTCLAGGEALQAAGYEFKTFHAPGHSPGSLCYYCAEAGVVLVGDVLFAGSIGRTDLPGGNQKQLLSSIHTLLKALPGETRVLPGHGPETTLEREKRTNPFLQ